MIPEITTLDNKQQFYQPANKLYLYVLQPGVTSPASHNDDGGEAHLTLTDTEIVSIQYLHNTSQTSVSIK